MNWRRACSLSQIPVGGTQALEVAGERLLLCRVNEAEIYAVADCCTHDDAPLDQAELDGRTIECPRHGARFDVKTGAVERLPAAFPLLTYPVRITADGWIEVAPEGTS